MRGPNPEPTRVSGIGDNVKNDDPFFFLFARQIISESKFTTFGTRLFDEQKKKSHQGPRTNVGALKKFRSQGS